MLNVAWKHELIGNQEAMLRYIGWLLAKRAAGKAIGGTFPQSPRGLPMPWPTPDFSYQVKHSEEGEYRLYRPFYWQCCECGKCEIDYEQTFWSPLNQFVPGVGKSYTETITPDTRTTDALWSLFWIIYSF